MTARDPRQYARITVDMPFNRKLKGAKPDAKWLAVTGVLWSVQNLTNGHVDPFIMTATAGVSAKFAKTLVDRDVWHDKGHACPDCPQPEHDGDVVIHDFLQHQDSAETVKRNRDEKAKAGRVGNHVKWKHAGPYEECGKCNS